MLQQRMHTHAALETSRRLISPSYEVPRVVFAVARIHPDAWLCSGSPLHGGDTVQSLVLHVHVVSSVGVSVCGVLVWTDAVPAAVGAASKRGWCRHVVRCAGNHTGMHAFHDHFEGVCGISLFINLRCTPFSSGFHPPPGPPSHTPGKGGWLLLKHFYSTLLHLGLYCLRHYLL